MRTQYGRFYEYVIKQLTNSFIVRYNLPIAFDNAHEHETENDMTTQSLERKIAKLESDIEYFEEQINLDETKADAMNAKIRATCDQIDNLYARIERLSDVERETEFIKQLWGTFG
jgi:septal ring factor EnvC (AmiA/AmiB activator)